MSLILALPWPPSRLSQNARVHWAVRARIAKRYRMDCFYLTRQQAPLQAIRLPFQPDGRLPIRIDFYPPDRRVRDDDNLISAFKHGRDGLALAWGIDDRFIRVGGVCLHETPVKGGRVQITVQDVLTSRGDRNE